MSGYSSYPGPRRQQGLRPCWRCGLSLALGLVLGAGPLLADEIKGTFKKVTAQHDTLTLTVGGRERTFPLSSHVKVIGLAHIPLKDGLDSKLFTRPGVLVSVKMEPRDGRDVVVELRVLRRSASPFHDDPP